MPYTESVAAQSTEFMSVAQLRTRVAELEGALHAIEEQIAIHEQVFFDNPIPSIVYSVEDLGILNANRSALDLYGYSIEEFRSLSLKDLFLWTGSEHQRLDAELRKPLNVLGSVQHRAAGGKELVVGLVSFAFETKGVNARMVMIEDRTERHTTEEALRTSEERFRELFENANDVIFLHDLKGNILEINRALDVYKRQIRRW